MKFYVVVVEDVEKLQFKFHENRTRLTMAKVFFSAIGSVKSQFLAILGTQNFQKCRFFSGNGE